MKLFRSPALRVVTYNQQEYKEINFALDKCIMGDEILGQQVNKKLRRPFLIVMEYFPGFNLGQALKERSNMLFHPDVMRGYIPDNVVVHPPPKV